MKTVKLIVSDWLKANGFDGLFNPDAACACLAGDLAPCGNIHKECHAGRRVNYAQGECPCGESCDWHIEIPTPPSVEAHIADALNWKCECGAVCDPFAADWRWSGYAWEHSHGYPLGHCASFRIDSGFSPGQSLPSVNPGT